jgi:hypothetical protein
LTLAIKNLISHHKNLAIKAKRTNIIAVCAAWIIFSAYLLTTHTIEIILFFSGKSNTINSI